MPSLERLQTLELRNTFVSEAAVEELTFPQVDGSWTCPRLCEVSFEQVVVGGTADGVARHGCWKERYDLGTAIEQGQGRASTRALQLALSRNWTRCIDSMLPN